MVDSAFRSSTMSLYSSLSLDEDNLMLTAKPHAFAGAVLSPKHARELTPALCLAIASALSEQAQRKAVVPYTLWITEAWRVLGWAEPSAALFWEMATMYHTLFLAGRALEDHYQDGSHIPPILSCGSASSVGSGQTNITERTLDKKKFSSTSSAKELPVWLVATFLLVHCEDIAYIRNVSGEDESRFYGGNDSTAKMAGNVDFSSLLKHSSLSPRTRLHAGWTNDNSHCTMYILRHLRKVLLLTAVPHNDDAVNACMHLAALSSPSPAPTFDHTRMRQRYNPEELWRQHEQEHDQVGLNVNLSMEDLERLHLLLQLPQGGGMDDPPVRIGEYLWSVLRGTQPSPMGTLPMFEVEREIRRQLELDLMGANDLNDKNDVSTDDEDVPSKNLAKLSFSESKEEGDTERAKQPDAQYQKELTYTHLRGTTIILKPNPAEVSSGASAGSGDHNIVSNWASSQRLHDLAINDCSDAHFYLLQPFEHVTVSGCTNCTILIGAVAGLLHIVDSEKANITSAARRVLISNSSDVTLCVFTPSAPLLVGDNRNCQLAPYNTYYDGLREDLLATGLAAAVVQESQSPYHGSRSVDEAAWPPLQCASNKWKQPIEMSKLEMPQVANAAPGNPQSNQNLASSPGADDKAMMKAGSGNDASMHAPVLLPAPEFHVLFVPVESEASRQRRVDTEESESNQESNPMQSQYCRHLAEVLQLSPFRLPVEYERRVLVKADRMKNIQQAVQKTLTTEQQKRFEDELNRGFRDWLVNSGNLRQVLDLVHLERRGGL